MNPLPYELAQVQIVGLHRQAERDRPACRARRAGGTGPKTQEVGVQALLPTRSYREEHRAATAPAGRGALTPDRHHRIQQLPSYSQDIDREERRAR